MKLDVTLVAGPGAAAERFPTTELSVSWPDGVPLERCSGASLATVLSRDWPHYIFTVHAQLLGTLQAGTPPLVNGAVIVAAPENRMPVTGTGVDSKQGSRLDSNHGVGLVLAVCAGPSAGLVVPLRRGSFTLGRGNCAVRIADPALSRHHGTISVAATGITFTAAEGSAGFRIHSQRSSAPTRLRNTATVSEGTPILCGNSVMELRFPSPVGDGERPRMLDSRLIEEITVARPASAASRRTMLAASLLPLPLGIVLALLTGSWMFLAFSAMGALSALAALVSGSKRRKVFRAGLAQALTDDLMRREQGFPDPAQLVVNAACPSTRVSASGPVAAGPDPPSGVALRLGVAEQAARIVLSPDDPGFVAPTVVGMAACVPLGPEPLSVYGPRRALLALARSFLMQLDAAQIPAVVWGSPADLPLAARFLPLVHVAATFPAVRSVVATTLCPAPLGDSPASGVNFHAAVLISFNDVPPSQRSWLHSVPGLRVVYLRFAESMVPDESGAESTERRGAYARSGIVAAGPEIRLSIAGSNVSGRTGSLCIPANTEFIPDGVPQNVFDSYARRRAGAHAAATGSGAGQSDNPLGPNSLPLPEHATEAAVIAAWQHTAAGPLVPVACGRNASGPAMIDLNRDGPHLLVAGTTGSGKSEFLRALVGALAAAHSPAELEFLFLDFKGGAGLGPLAALPHTTWLMTDLQEHQISRALTSLRAELHRRESLLAGAHAGDADEYRARTIQSGPTQPERPRMAHIVVVIDEFRVLIEQHPQAMTELMRLAAVGRSLGIHLVMATQRPQGAINADIRANVTSSVCLRVQSSFDSTDVLGTAAAAGISPATPGRAFISRAGGPPEEFQCATLRVPDTSAQQLPQLRLSSEALHEEKEAAACHAPAPEGSAVAHVAALLGGAWESCGRPAAAPPVVAADLPLHIDSAKLADNGTAGVSLGLLDLPEQQKIGVLRWHPATHSHIACLGTPRESSAVLALVSERLLAQCAEESPLMYMLDGDGSLGAFAYSPSVGGHVGANDLRSAARIVDRLLQVAAGTSHQLILCITDWGRWVTAFRASPWHGAEEQVMKLIRFGGGHVTLMISGERELVTAQFFNGIPNRVYLPLGSTPEATLAWPRLLAIPPIPGRAAVMGPINDSACGARQAAPHAAQFAQAGQRESTPAPAPDPGSQAEATLRVVPLPRLLTVSALEAAVKAEVWQADSPLSVVLGIGGDGTACLSLTLIPGVVLPVVGGAGTGKSSFIDTLGAINSGANVQWLEADTLSAEQVSGATQHLAAGGAVVLAFSYPGPALHRLPLEWGLRTAQRGVVLRPQRPQDGEFFGTRLATSGDEPPGRAVLVDGGREEWFQVPANAAVG